MLLVFFYIGIVLFYYLFKRDKIINHRTFLIIGTFVYLILLSCFRPSQRYLLQIVPIILCFVFSQNFFKNNIKKIFATSMLIYIPLNFYLLTNSFLSSRITQQIMNDLKANNLIEITNLGIINAHSGFEVNSSKKSQKLFIIQDDVSPNTVKIYEVNIFYVFKKKFYLNKL